jgi:polyhydroxyalkanoic acid synthase PhaR subunit
LSTQPPPNPFEAFKAAYDQAAESWSRSMEQVLSSEDFASAAGRMVARYADAQETLRKAAEATSDQLHLPTKDDLARVAEIILNLERKVDEATDQLFALARSTTEASSTNQLAQISDRLAALEAAIAGLARKPAEATPPPTADAPGAKKAAPRSGRPRRAAPKE